MCHDFPGVVCGGAGPAGIVVEVLVGGVAAAVPQQVRLVTASVPAATAAVSSVGLQRLLGRVYRVTHLDGYNLLLT